MFELVQVASVALMLIAVPVSIWAGINSGRS